MTSEATAVEIELKAFGVTDVGLERKNNEDALVIIESCGFYAVCDGMGGHASGELASRLAVEAMGNFVEHDIRKPDFRWPFHAPETVSVEAQILDNAVKLANKTVFESARGNPRHKGMGTTVVALLISDNKVACVHVGDSRLYRLRDGQLQQMTTDHSLLNHYKRTRDLTEEQVRNFKGKNVIVRAVGLKDSVQPELAEFEAMAGDIFLLCTDGLTDLVADDLIQEQLEVGHSDLEQGVRALIRAALTRGGKDNVTALMLRVDEAGAGGSRVSQPQPEYLEDTSPGFDVDAGDAWDMETLPAFDASPLMVEGHANAPAPDLAATEASPAAESVSLDSHGAAIPPPPGVKTDSAPTDTHGRNIPPPPPVTGRRLSPGRSTRVPAPESPFAGKPTPQERPAAVVHAESVVNAETAKAPSLSPTTESSSTSAAAGTPSDSTTADTERARIVPVNELPTAPYRSPDSQSATGEAIAAPQPPNMQDIFQAPTERLRAIPLPPNKKD